MFKTTRPGRKINTWIARTNKGAKGNKAVNDYNIQKKIKKQQLQNLHN